MARRRRFVPLAASVALLAGLARDPPGRQRRRGGRDGARRPGRRLLLRPGPQGLPRHAPEHQLQGLVHGRGRRAFRRLLSPRSTTPTLSTLQYVVTDGSTFTDLQTRDMTYTVQADPTGMQCTVTSTDAKHGFQLVTTYITDPHGTPC